MGHDMDLELRGKVALVTGASRGIGRGIAEGLASEGCSLLLTGRDEAELAETAARVTRLGGKAKSVAVDLRTDAAPAKLLAAAREAYGRLDILVNNAGIRMYQTVVEASAESWDELLGINLKSYIYCAKAAIPEMRKVGGGSIVNVASVRSVMAGKNTIQYDTAKAAIAGFTRGLAMDHGPENIRANAVCPGPIFTPFHARRIAAAGQTIEQYNKDAAAGTMLKRPGRSEEMAACILFLASDDASYCTGSLLFADGGMTAM
jgi:NAD(P)-dependent dehydrogenase (short-subunit alcohol dehydrogenase family)